jgi:hypothetical protein
LLAYLLSTAENKALIAGAGGIPLLIRLAADGSTGVKIEAIAALANLAVNGSFTHSLWSLLLTWPSSLTLCSLQLYSSYVLSYLFA